MSCEVRGVALFRPLTTETFGGAKPRVSGDLHKRKTTVS